MPSDSDKGKIAQDNKSNYKKIVNKAKKVVKFVQSKLLKRDSEDPNDKIDKLYRLTDGWKMALQ